MEEKKRHELKVWVGLWCELYNGHKTAEFRKDDRRFQLGDELILREWDQGKEEYTGRVLTAEVSHIVRGPSFGVPDGYAMLSLRNMKRPPPDLTQ